MAYYNEEHIYPNNFLCKCLQEIAAHGNRHLTDIGADRKVGYPWPDFIYLCILLSVQYVILLKKNHCLVTFKYEL